MIYFISSQKIIETEDIKQSTVDECLEYFKGVKFIGFDIETQGFNRFKHKVLSIQFGDTFNQFVIDCTTIDWVKEFKEFLEDEYKVFIGHNLQFDLKFMLHQRIIVKNVWDTYVCEVILNNGIPGLRYSLDFVSERYTNIIPNKANRGLIHRESFSHRVIRYCAEDTTPLLSIKDKQQEIAIQTGRLNALKLNNQFVPVLTYIVYSGIKLDVNKWKLKIAKDKQELQEIKRQLDNYIIDNNITRFIEGQLDLFNPEVKTNINWKSPQQVVKLFSLLGIDTQILDKETGEIKHSVSSKWLSSKSKDNAFIALYIKYGECYKQLSTYGENFFKHIEPTTGRMYTVFRQYINTGRMSSGGKNKNTKEEYINFQNIPSDELTRSCFIPEENNVYVDSDYDSQEVRIFANFCMDEALLNMFDSGFKDMHSFTAWHVFSYIRDRYPDLTIDTLNKVKKEYPKERFIAKTANFAIQYGGNGTTIATNCNIPIKEGVAFYNKYFETFTGVKNYFDTVYKLANYYGYIKFNKVTGDFYYTKTLKDDEIKRNSQNYPIQGTSASITKYATYLYYQHLLKEGLLFKVLIPNMIHDEILIECPKELAEQESIILKQCMEDAGLKFVQRIKLTATPKISTHWEH